MRIDKVPWVTNADRMSADWARLTVFLGKQGDFVRLAWQELDDIVGGMPESAVKHSAWWGGDRPHTRAWKRAGYEVAERQPGVAVTFRRLGSLSTAVEPSPAEIPTGIGTAGALGVDEGTRRPDALLVTCSKQKHSVPSAARDLYISPTFRKSRRYAEQSGSPWFILSAEHGLVAPGEWLAPYDRYLPDTPPEYRRAWGEWVAARLELLLGRLEGKLLEIHASQAYVSAARPGLDARGARLLLPLSGLAQGQRSAWYDEHLNQLTAPVIDEAPQAAATRENPAHWAARLSEESRAVPPSQLEPMRQQLQQPGLYTWWVDAEGAQDLSRGLGDRIAEGLIYAGQAGATRWPSGRSSSNTLWSRLVGMHLGKKAEFSTFRKTLAAILRVPFGWSGVNEVALTCWMHEHLRVLPLPHPDGDSLRDLEEKVLSILDPPLNLQGMTATDVRRRLSDLRRSLPSAVQPQEER
jgi:hypothetical protein